MRLVLHIGMATTGTSTLQSKLDQHARPLAKSGILYPTARAARLNIRDVERGAGRTGQSCPQAEPGTVLTCWHRPDGVPLV
jgi:hypothetical protein